MMQEMAVLLYFLHLNMTPFAHTLTLNDLTCAAALKWLFTL